VLFYYFLLYTVLTEHIVGRAPGGETVQLVEDARFTFFDVPGIALVPSLLETVSEECCSSALAASAADSANISRGGGVIGGGSAGGRGGGGESGVKECGREGGGGGGTAAQKAHEKSTDILKMFEEHFDDSLTLPSPRFMMFGFF